MIKRFLIVDTTTFTVTGWFRADYGTIEDMDYAIAMLNEAEGYDRFFYV